MEEQNNLYDKLKKMIGDKSANINILQEQIDVKLQMKYFQKAKDIKKTLDKEYDYLSEVNKLYEPEVPTEEKQDLVCALASFDKVDYYRALEQYKAHAEEDMQPWVTLGLQESRMLLESELLDEKQLFVSTGLGGKGTNLRYFVVLINNDDENYTDVQKDLIGKEFEYTIKKNGGELEEVQFEEKFAMLTCLLPIEKPVQEILSNTTKECNSFGKFIHEHFLITNVKKMTTEEIKEFLETQAKGDDFNIDIDQNNDLNGEIDDVDPELE